jgi:lipopolysaccharide/colanic/teichoic acid biosynthesis glycosyltransferase
MMTTTITKKLPVLSDSVRSKDTIPTPFLFVRRTKESISSFPEEHEQDNTVQDLDQAKAHLKALGISGIPELIILDIPINQRELTVFKRWLSQNFVPPILIFYKESWLNQGEIKRLFQLNLIDDVIKDDRNTDLLLNKIGFLKSLTVQSLIDPRPARKAEKIKKPIHREFIKRALDIFISLTILIALSPLLLIIAMLIKLTSKGPVIYKSKRAGEGFKVFNFYKFRTMITGAEEMLESLTENNMYKATKGSPAFFKVSNDPRITKVGLFLRNTSLDELPQLFNVLKGDMSLVGNRPLPLYEATTLTTTECAERFMAPAGITGLWQISKRGKAKMSAEERVFLDITYARNRTTRSDLKILLTTPTALIQKQSQ